MTPGLDINGSKFAFNFRVHPYAFSFLILLSTLNLHADELYPRTELVPHQPKDLFCELFYERMAQNRPATDLLDPKTLAENMSQGGLRTALEALSRVTRLNLQNDPMIIAELIQLSRNPDAKTRKQALDSIASLGVEQNPAINNLLRERLNDSDQKVRISAIMATARIGSQDPQIISQIKNLISDSDPKIVANALKAIASTHSYSAPALYFADAHFQLKVEKHDVVAGLKACLADEDPNIVLKALRLSQQLKLKEPALIQSLLALTHSTDERLRSKALQTISELGLQTLH